MKKVMVLLAISLAATALFDVTLFFQSTPLGIAAAGVVFFFVGYLFYYRIIEKPVINTILLFSFLDALMCFGYTVNRSKAHLWGIISICAVLGYAAGIVAKRIITKNRKPIDAT